MKRTIGKHIEKFALAGWLAAGMTPGAASGAEAAGTMKQAKTEKPSTQSKFYCNIKALSPEERIAHQKLTEKLLAVKTQVAETDKGYELQFAPTAVSLAELAAWVQAEGKCCPFFDFHIDLEQGGTLLCLRLTGEPGVKQFMQSEFKIAGQS